jgi:hypothetical protein
VFALVGKGIVYDSGGYSIKSKTGMPGMKMDMGGAAALLGAFATLVGTGGFTRTLHLVLCCAANMVSGDAQRPDDVVKMLSGRTVEVNNTDAEGRLVLADGVYYARHTLNVSSHVHIASTLGPHTGERNFGHGYIDRTSSERYRRVSRGVDNEQQRMGAAMRQGRSSLWRHGASACLRTRVTHSRSDGEQSSCRHEKCESGCIYSKCTRA